MEENIIYSSFQSTANEYDKYGNMVEALLAKANEHTENGKTDWITCAATGESYEYSSFNNLTRRIGSALNRRGLRKGDIVIFMAVDIAKLHMFLTGVWRANGIARASYPEEDFETILATAFESRCGWIYCEPGHASLCRAVAQKIYWDVEVIVASREPVDGCTTIYELMEDNGSELPELDLTLDDTALIMCTSGTTGMSKGATLTHLAVMWMATQLGKLPFFEDKTNLILTKGTHISGAIFPFAGFMRGVSVVYLTYITKQRIFDAVNTYKPSFMFGFPTFLLMLVNDPEASKLDLSNLEIITSGGAPVTPAVVNTLMTIPSLKCALNVYGLTECAPIVTAFDYDQKTNLSDRPEMSMGKLVPDSSAKFIDAISGNPVGPGEMGELCFKCDGLFSTYYLNPEATNKAFDDQGYFKTGDVGYYDREGYIFLVDRAKEIFKYFNNHISPTEIENIILNHPKIREVSVIGIPDPNGGGHIPRAVCVIVDDSEITPADILKYTNEKLATYKHVRGGVYFIKELPKGKTGKVTRQLVEKLQLE